MDIVINLPDTDYSVPLTKIMLACTGCKVIELPEGHGRLGDLDELEQRISNFVEHDADITDAYTVIRQKFIVDDIRETPTIIQADKRKQ